MSAPLGAVIVGTGFGVRVHVPALRAAGFAVRGIVGRDLERTSRRAERTGTTVLTLDGALGRADVHVVTIATPPSTHAPIAHAAIAAGKHVLCEKPFTLDAAEAAGLVDAATHAGVIGLVGHEFRWAPERALVARAIADGRIGAPRAATFVQYSPLVADPGTRMPEWWFDPAAGGGWLGASGSHAVDQVRAWLGEFDSVAAALGRTAASREGADDTFTVRFRLRNGVDGVLQQSGGAWGPRVGFTRVAGTEGTVWIDRDVVWLADDSDRAALPVPDDLALPDAEPSDDPRHRFTHLELGPYTRLCTALRSAIEGTPVPEAGPGGVAVPTFADGLACMQVLDAIRASAAAGGARTDIGEVD